MVAAAGAQYVIPLIPTELIYNTHKSPPNPFCWASRPCYRELGCEYCWQRKRKFLLRQIRYLGVKWGLSNFCTLTATNFDGDQHMALRLPGARVDILGRRTDGIDPANEGIDDVSRSNRRSIEPIGENESFT